MREVVSPGKEVTDMLRSIFGKLVSLFRRRNSSHHATTTPRI